MSFLFPLTNTSRVSSSGEKLIHFPRKILFLPAISLNVVKFPLTRIFFEVLQHSYNCEQNGFSQHFQHKSLISIFRGKSHSYPVFGGRQINFWTFLHPQPGQIVDDSKGPPFGRTSILNVFSSKICQNWRWQQGYPLWSNLIIQRIFFTNLSKLTNTSRDSSSGEKLIHFPRKILFLPEISLNGPKFLLTFLLPLENLRWVRRNRFSGCSCSCHNYL